MLRLAPFALGIVAIGGCHFLGDVHDVSFVDGGCHEAAECGALGECQLPLCAEGQCAFTNVATRSPCEGGICDGQGSCVGCLGSEDCASGRCQDGLCVDESCTNMMQDGNETAVDCGGPCVPCSLGEGCVEAQDCKSDNCDGSTCQPCVGGLCPFGGYCDAGECADFKPLGEPCQEDIECLSGKCDESSNTCSSGD